MRIVWFKRDLRLDDHLALKSAAKEGDLLLLYIVEPHLWQQPDMSHRQYAFLCECLLELKHQLKAIGHNLVIKVGQADEIFKKLHQQRAITSIWSHQETWNGWTYKRDLDIKTWTETNQIPWHEFRQNGVIRALKTRNGWAKNGINI